MAKLLYVLIILVYVLIDVVVFDKKGCCTASIGSLSLRACCWWPGSLSLLPRIGLAGTRWGTYEPGNPARGRSANAGPLQGGFGWLATVLAVVVVPMEAAEV